ncbi:CIR protein PIR protein [Plasmodium vinckei petteri]|uniref:CIR protein PIR protein n=1 Tax=Plasmodium vinckei petteri TaxID=138298 RepID=A0A6V7TIE5_PLAVN|nr:CIR protein PIR protein [Plasmodium vinckei petteri]
MAKYSIEDLYGDINTIDSYFREENRGGAIIEITDNTVQDYCHYGNNSGQGKCNGYLEKASSGVIHVLKDLEKYGLEYDKLAEYAILWLRYKLNQQRPYYNTQLNEFYTKHIETNKDYNKKIKDNDNDSLTYKEIIDTKKDLMGIKEMTKFSYPFKLLLLLYDKNSKNSGKCPYSDYAKYFAKGFEELNNDSNNIKDSSYNKLLYRLSDDYNNLISKCTNFPPLPEIKTTPNKLIPVLSTFSVIPVFLGIAYKYSLFGVDKLFQRQYLRKKLKKVKNKLKLNI